MTYSIKIELHESTHFAPFSDDCDICIENPPCAEFARFFLLAQNDANPSELINLALCDAHLLEFLELLRSLESA